jgi:hypothetical protein
MKCETENLDAALNSAGPLLTARLIMTAKSFSLLAAVVFAIGAVAQFLRIAMGWDVIVNGMPLPFWPNWIAVVVLGGLSLLGFRAAARG